MTRYWSQAYHIKVSHNYIPEKSEHDKQVPESKLEARAAKGLYIINPVLTGFISELVL